MKKINIKYTDPINPKSVIKEQKLYSLTLGSGNIMTFNNKRTAYDYAVYVEKNINDFIRTSNIIYADIFRIYRLYWLVLDKSISKKISEKLDSLNHNLNIIFERNQIQVISICYEIYKCLDYLIKELSEYFKLKRVYPLLYDLNTSALCLNNNSLVIQIIKSHSTQKFELPF